MSNVLNNENVIHQATWIK